MIETAELEAVRAVVVAAADRLDREDLGAWLALFADDGAYELAAYSPELRRTMVWWSAPLHVLRKQLDEVPQHERDPARRLHVLGPVTVGSHDAGARADVTFAVYRTLPDGRSSLYAVGRYDDTLVRTSAGWRLQLHRAVLETRMLDAFTHLPL